MKLWSTVRHIRPLIRRWRQLVPNRLKQQHQLRPAQNQPPSESFMSDSSETTSANSPEVSELKAQCAELQSQTHTLRIILLFVVGALCLFFWREANYHGAIAQQMQPQVMQASQYTEALSKQGSSSEKQLQAIQGAVSRLVEYGRSHPDYVPILTKYGIPIAPASSAPVATPASAPKK